MIGIDWDKPLVDKDGRNVRYVSRLLKPLSDGRKILCIIECRGSRAGETTHVFFFEDGRDLVGNNLRNLPVLLDWNKPLIFISTGEYCRMICDDVKTKDPEIKYLCLITNPKGFETQTIIVDNEGRASGGIPRVRNKIENTVGSGNKSEICDEGEEPMWDRDKS